MKYSTLLFAFLYVSSVYAQISKAWDKSYTAATDQFFEFAIDDKDNIHNVRSGNQLTYEIYNKSGDLLYIQIINDTNASLIMNGKPVLNDRFECFIPVVKQLSGGAKNYHCIASMIQQV